MRRSLLAVSLLIAALALVVWALLDARFRDLEGYPAAPMCLPLAAGAALLLLCAAARGGWLLAGSWFALALFGQACALQLYEAGPEVVYPDYSLSDEGGWKWIPLIGLAIQLELVAWGVLLQLRELARDIRERIGPRRALLLLVLAALGSLAFFTDVPSWLAKSGFAIALQLLSLANVVLAARALPEESLEALRARLGRWLGPPGEEVEPGGRRCGLLAGLFAFATCALLCLLVYERHPHVPDEVVYAMHAEYLAEGELSMPRPPVAEGFEVDLMLLDGERWYCPVPPGWPFVLAIGELFGLAWLVNPILAGASAWVAALLLRELLDRRSARLAVLLLATSPWFLFMGMNLMPHTLALFAALLAALGVARAQRGAPAAWCWLAGAGLGVVALIRPLEGLVLAVCLGLWALGLGGKRVRWSAFAGLVLGAVIVGGLVLPYNQALSGSATKFPIMDYVDKLYGPGRNALGFGANRGLGWGGLDPYPGHDLGDVLINAQLNLSAVNMELFGWGLGCLLPILFVCLRGRWQRVERVMLAAIALVVFAHSFYWFSGGPDFGARYWYLILLPCVVLSVRGLQRLAREDAGLGETRVLAATLVLVFTSLTVFFPWRILDKYHHYRGMRPDVRELAREHELGRSLVLVRGRRHPDYASAAIYNPTDLEADAPIYAWARNDEVREKLLEHYADREVWILDGPTVTGRGYEIVAGPLPAAEVE